MSSLKTPYIIPPPCDHLASYKLKHGLTGFASLQDSLKIAPGGNSTISLPDSWPPSCSSCNGSGQRLYLCLCCSWVFCIDHTLSHARSFLGHEIVVDVDRAELYCGSCQDQVYDPEFDRAVMCKYLREVMPRGRNGFEGIGIISERSSKRRRLVSGLDSEFSVSKQLICSGDQRAKSCYPLGLRGLNNLGNTCFMNSVLQVLLHAPPLRNYFLGDKHNREVCRKGSADRFCLLCDIDVIFTAVFSGDRSPFSPAQFLYSWWQHAANLASYEQQDAHEFFISLLDGIHEKEGKAKDLNKDGRDCSCIAHRVFSGLLRSDVTCMTCGYTSTTYDPCMDISLHMDTNSSLSADSPNKANKSSSNNPGNSTSTLIGCLDLFTRPEKLGSDQKLHCQNCQERQHSLKQLSIRRLPLVLCLHIKRFEHSLVRKASRKIDWYLQFPFSLDMSPYLSSSIVRKRFGNRIFPFEGDESEISSEFEIFAIVTHTGMLESGHYVTFVRLRNMWYKCDDSWVTEVDEKTVRASQCYMVFYVQKPLYYKANEELSCIPISSQRDAFLPVVGCC